MSYAKLHDPCPASPDLNEDAFLTLCEGDEECWERLDELDRLEAAAGGCREWDNACGGAS